MPSPETEKPPLRGLPIQFSLRPALIYITISAALLGTCKWLNLGLGIAFVAMTLILLMAWLVGLKETSEAMLVPIYETDSEVDAVLCCNHLNASGVWAITSPGAPSGIVVLVCSRWRVAVLVKDADRARELLRSKELAERE